MNRQVFLAMRANKAVRDMMKALENGADPSVVIIKVMFAVAQSDEALWEIEKIGRNGKD